MKGIIFILTILLVPLLLIAQKKSKLYAEVDERALELPDSATKTTDGIAGYISANFNSDLDKARAAFIWIATNIRYDIDNMFAINFYESEEEKISKPLKTRKGICENYAALFNDICLKSGVKSYMVEGYTKQNGFTDYIPHAWCAALIDSSWFLFDPTWGSGYVHNGRFVPRIDNNYFKASPSVLIKSHMPFDYLWQFLNYPVTSQEFYQGKIQPDNYKTFFSFPDSLIAYEKQTPVERLEASAARIERNGVKNSMVFDRLQHIKMELENHRQTQMANLYNDAASDYNSGIDMYNDFINYRNKQFTPKKTDTEIQSMIDDASNKLKESRTKLNEIKTADANQALSITQLLRAIDDAAVQVKEQQDWLKTYLSKNKAGRKAMFYERVTFFGK